MLYRRQFLVTGLGVTGACVLSGVPASAQDSPLDEVHESGPSLKRGQADKLALTEADKAVLSYMEAFTKQVYLLGGSVAGKTASSNYRCTQLIASIADLDLFQDRLTAKDSPVSKGMAMGNRISFNHLDTTFEVEFLVEEEFQKRVAGIGKGLRANGEPMVFAHEALLYDPKRKVLMDPYKAIRGRTASLKRVRFTDSYEELFQASLETICYNLAPSAKDQSALDALFARKVANKKEAKTIARAFLQSLSLASQVSTRDGIGKFFSSNLVRSALLSEFGFDGLRVPQNFARVRPRQPASITDGTIWHAVCRASEKNADGTGRVPTAVLGGSCQLKTFLTMQEYQNVGIVTSDSSFRIYV